MSVEPVANDEKIAVTIRGLRRFGRLFVALTVIMGVFLLVEAFDPSVSFRNNGVEVHSVPQRLLSILPIGFLAAFGAFFAFAPRSVMDRLLRYQMAELEKMKCRLRLKK